MQLVDKALQINGLSTTEGVRGTLVMARYAKLSSIAFMPLYAGMTDSAVVHGYDIACFRNSGAIGNKVEICIRGIIDICRTNFLENHCYTMGQCRFVCDNIRTSRPVCRIVGTSNRG